MATENERLSSLSIEVEAELRQRIEDAAAARHLSTRDFVVAALRRAVNDRGGPDRPATASEWTRLSASAFARDWDSDADAVYDDLA